MCAVHGARCRYATLPTSRTKHAYDTIRKNKTNKLCNIIIVMGMFCSYIKL